ncbi:MAG: pirin family protein [Candidatus Eremiobacteraeota bacterium]|nr:pirin family protein [Candidatus Eremiobacteraeota bacterium]
MTAAASFVPIVSVQRSQDRYFADHGWLRTNYSLSFADYYDPANLNWGALRVFNEDYIGAGQGFPPHPHRDMEILTYVFEGELEHKDSMGNHGVVSPGGVQFMSAGTGVRHSEFNHSSNLPLHLVQMWVVPGRSGVPPAYGQQQFAPADRRNRWLEVASGQARVPAPVALTQDATLRVARLENGELEHEFGPQRYGFVFVGEGEASINEHTLKAGDALRTYGLRRLVLRGSAEIVFWDLPAIDSI